jgi:Ca2+-binding EF-hand superfamily protein
LDVALHYSKIRRSDLVSKARQTGPISYPNIAGKKKLIQDFVAESKNKKYLKAFASYDLDSNNTIGFATLVYSAKSILLVADNKINEAAETMSEISDIILQD